MIDNGLMNFQSTTHLSPSLVLLRVAWAYGWSWNWNLDKVLLLLPLLHLLVADGSVLSQLQIEKQVLRLLRMRQHVQSHLAPDILYLHESLGSDGDIRWTQMEEELQYLIHLHRKPLGLQDLARFSKRKAVRDQDFKSSVSRLPIPHKMKAAFRADITRQLLTSVFAHYLCAIFFECVILDTF